MIRSLTNSIIPLFALCASAPLAVHADDTNETTPPELSAAQRADDAPLIDHESGDARFLLDIRGECGRDTTSRLGVMVADTAVTQDYTTDTIDAAGFAISVPRAQLAGLQPEMLCPRLLRSNPTGDGTARYAVPDAFTAFVTLRCTDDGSDRVRTAYRAVALDALINCESPEPPETEAEPG